MSLIKNSVGQVSLEYLLVLTAFFSILVVLIPIISETTNSFFSTSDNLLAKSIESDLTESISLMSFLGDGSIKFFEYSPVRGLTISSRGSKVIILTELDSFEVETNHTQFIQKTFFDKKFSFTIKKVFDKIEVSVKES